jgi:hypothetical protein
MFGVAEQLAGELANLRNPGTKQFETLRQEVREALSYARPFHKGYTSAG